MYVDSFRVGLFRELEGALASEIDMPPLVARLRRLAGRRDLAGRSARSPAAPDDAAR
jgi:hypothetical protein